METRWYLCAESDHPFTNEYLAHIIGEQYPEEVYPDKLCADGRTRNLYGCPRGYADVQRAAEAVPDYNLKLAVFQQTLAGDIIRYELWKKPVQKKVKRQNYLRAIHRTL